MLVSVTFNLLRSCFFRLTSRGIVADGVHGVHAEEGSSRAGDGSTSGLLGTLPDDLGEVAILFKVATGVLLAVVLEVLHFTIVPLSSDAAGGSLGLATKVTAVSVRSKVLASTVAVSVML